MADKMEDIVRDTVAQSRNVGRQRRWITAEWAKYICLGNTVTRTQCEGAKIVNTIFHLAVPGPRPWRGVRNYMAG